MVCRIISGMAICDLSICGDNKNPWKLSNVTNWQANSMPFKKCGDPLENDPGF